jgi:hypothetical protein
MLSQSEAPDFSIKEMFVFNNDTCTMLNRNSFTQWLRDRSGKPGEAIVCLLCAGLEANSPY